MIAFESNGLPPEQIETRAASEMKQHDLASHTDDALLTLRSTYLNLADCLRNGIMILHLPAPQSAELWERCAALVELEIVRRTGQRQPVQLVADPGSFIGFSPADDWEPPTERR